MIALLSISMVVVLTIVYCNSNYHTVQKNSKLIRRALKSDKIDSKEDAANHEQNLWKELFSSSSSGNMRGSLSSAVLDEREDSFDDSVDDATELLDDTDQDDYYYSSVSYNHRIEENTDDDEINDYLSVLTSFFKKCDIAQFPFPLENSPKLDPTPFFAWFTYFYDSASDQASDWTSFEKLHETSLESLDDDYEVDSAREVSSEDTASSIVDIISK